jgi:dipeptidyl aminopeptidase/acylaminoacyl peptidase
MSSTDRFIVIADSLAPGRALRWPVADACSNLSCIRMQYASSTEFRKPRAPSATAGSPWLALLCFVATVGPVATSQAAPPPPPSIDQLAASGFVATLRRERALRDAPGYMTYLVSYPSAGLWLRALVAVPTLPPPPGGYPVLVACHGTHPDPPRYGYTAAGVDDRPGDYYRSVPDAYAAHGFLVLMPDYRGHNDSEGGEFARGPLAPAYFAQDVRDLLSALPSLPQADPRNVFLWGHSLGGAVALRVLLALDGLQGVRLRAASLWSTVGGGVPMPGASPAAKPALSVEDPLSFLDRLQTPLLIQHGRGDRTAPYAESERLAVALERLGRPHRLVPYPTDQHFFAEPQRGAAVARDVEFFRAHLAAPAPP